MAKPKLELIQQLDEKLGELVCIRKKALLAHKEGTTEGLLSGEEIKELEATEEEIFQTIMALDLVANRAEELLRYVI